MSDSADTATMAPGSLLAGKRGLIMGVANERSIAWGIAAAASQGAELAFSYQMEGFGNTHDIIIRGDALGTDIAQGDE